MIKSLRPSLSLPKWSVLSIVPSYGKVFGDQLIPAEIVVIIAVLFTIRAAYQHYKWTQLSHPLASADTDTAESEKTTSRLVQWESIPDNAILVVERCLVAVHFLLLFQSVDTMESMATLRAAISFFLVFTSLIWVLFVEKRKSQTSKSRPTNHDSLTQISGSAPDPNLPLDLAPLLHMVWALQTYILPGFWVYLQNTALNTPLFASVVWMANIFWIMGAIVYSPSEKKKEEVDLVVKEVEDDSSLSEIVKLPQSQCKVTCELKRKEYSVAMTVLIVDFFITIIFCF